MHAAGRRFVLSAYVGDSPAFLSSSAGDFVDLTSTKHSPDNLDEWLDYLRRAEEEGFDPQLHPFTIFRANGGVGSPRVEWPPGTGRHTKIPLWKPGASPSGWVPNELGIAAVHAKGMPIGGCQSPRKYVITDPDGSTINVMPGHEHRNMGNTVDLGCQATRTLGDYNSRPYTHGKPTVGVHELNGEGYLVSICSDGVGDLYFSSKKGLPPSAKPHQVLEFVMGEHLGKPVDQVVHEMWANTEILAEEAGPPYHGMKHDDMSLVVITIPPLVAGPE